MLTKKDIQMIDEVSRKNAKEEITKGLMDFWENVLEPYLSTLNRENERNDREHSEMMNEIRLLREDMHGHEKRITVLETRTAR